ncbi:MAG: YgiT-type zinc finger protein [Nitrospirae bacterium]|nr:YgiT-type zinc finger protein [Nitrospirota bacterium]
MRCFECGGELIRTAGDVRMTKPDGGLVIFTGVPLNECRQCGEQYVSGEWSEKIGHLLRRADQLSAKETLTVPVIAVG